MSIPPHDWKKSTDCEAIQPRQDIVAFREDSVMVLARRQLVDADQIAVAFRFRNAFLTVLDAKHESMGFREWQAPRGITATRAESQARAQEDLSAARELLGAYLYALLGRVCGEGYAVKDLFQVRRDCDTHTDLLRIGLTQLVRLWL